MNGYTMFNALHKYRLLARNVKMAVFWVVAPCGLVEVYQRFRESNSRNSKNTHCGLSPPKNDLI
jgi:hypothetical protein